MTVVKCEAYECVYIDARKGECTLDTVKMKTIPNMSLVYCEKLQEEEP